MRSGKTMRWTLEPKDFSLSLTLLVDLLSNSVPFNVPYFTLNGLFVNYQSNDSGIILKGLIAGMASSVRTV